MQKLYSTKFEFTKSEFKAIWETTKPRNEHKDERLKMQALENQANKIAKQLPHFNFNDFERLFLTKNKTYDIHFYYQKVIEQYKKNNQIGTASNYELS